MPDDSARLLADTGVAVVPGLDFVPVDGNRLIRMCLAGEHADLERAVELIGDWIG